MSYPRVEGRGSLTTSVARQTQQGSIAELRLASTPRVGENADDAGVASFQDFGQQPVQKQVKGRQDVPTGDDDFCSAIGDEPGDPESRPVSCMNTLPRFDSSALKTPRYDEFPRPASELKTGPEGFSQGLSRPASELRTPRTNAGSRPPSVLKTPRYANSAYSRATSLTAQQEGDEFDEDDDDDEDFLLEGLAEKKPPIAHRWNVLPCLLFIFFGLSCGFYLYIRVITLAGMYATFIFAAECLGLTSFIPYAILLTRCIYSTGSNGLEEADKGDTSERRFNIRVLVPCYKEPLDVVAGTVMAALNAKLPAGSDCTVYLLDDGNGAEKRAFIESLNNPKAQYITGRVRTALQINGKSENVNNALRKIYGKEPKKSRRNRKTEGSQPQVEWADISNGELVVVFDADMRAKPEFFLKTLEVMSNDEIALCLTPQAFHNVDLESDLFNNNNKQFWEYWLPGAFAWGYIACTGTNFVIRARALAHCGLFPTNCITEDYALGMELKRKGYKATYLAQYVAEGEAPLEIRNVLQQRSRWTKGHFQVFFSGENPLISPDLPFFQRLWYSYAAWAPLCTIFTVPIFMAVPFMSIVFGLHPVVISFYFVLASTLYVTSILCIQYYVVQWADLKIMWFVNISNTILWFTFTKALLNTFLARMGFKRMQFKVTVKKETGGEASTPLLQPSPPPPQELEQGHRSAVVPQRAPSTVIEHIKRTASIVSQRIASVVMAPADRNDPERAPFLSTSSSGSPRERSPSIGKSNDVRNQKDVHRLAHRNVKTVGGEQAATQATLASKMDGNRPRTIMGLYGNDAYHLTQEHDQEQVHLPAFYPDVDISRSPVAFSTTGMSTAQTLKRRHNASEPNSPGAMGSRNVGGLPTILSVPCSANSILPFGAAPTVAQTDDGNKKTRLKKFIESYTPQNMEDFGQMLDPVAILTMFIFCIVTASLGAWQLTISIPAAASTDFALNSPLKGSPYIFVATLWALHNAVAPYLFLHYCASAGKSFKFMVKWLSLISTLVMVTAMVLIWMLIPEEFSIREALSLGVNHLYPNAIAQDTNTNYAFVMGLNNTPVMIPNEVNLSGGFLVSDNVKYGMPSAYAVASLAWAYIQYPSGFSNDRPVILQTLRDGASFLMNCNLNPGDASNPLWAAQVGDGAEYVVIEDRGYDPEAAGMVWTSPLQDPQLVGDDRRMVWVMSKDSPGADLMAGYAAALAAVSIAFKNVDATFSAQALLHAKEAYQLATLNDSSPASYCRYVPCTHNVTIKTEAVVRLLDEVDANATECWYADWVGRSCRVGPDMDTCIEALKDTEDVFTTKLACCNAMIDADSWSLLYTKAQGVCAVPENQWSCYIPDPSQRTCYKQDIDRSTGIGCTGKGLEIFSSPLSCCNYLSREGLIDASLGLTGSGMCAQENLDTSFTQCYVPVLADRTCILRNGANCSFFGTESAFNDPVGCCNKLISMMSDVAPPVTNPLAVAPRPEGICLFHNTTLPTSIKTSSGNGTSPRGKSPPTRRLLGTEDTALAKAAELKRNLTLWKIPILNSTSLCGRKTPCHVYTLEENKEVALYNSTSVFDDLAWGGIWLYKATGDPTYLGQAQRFLRRHYTEDINSDVLRQNRSYYVSDWNNLAWSANAMLVQLTEGAEYVDRIEEFLDAWVFGNSLASNSDLPEPSRLGFDPAHPVLKNFTDPATNLTFEIVPSCVPTSTYESNCFDNIDNDCDGNIDKQDVTCGMFPVLYTLKQLAYSQSPSLPHAANSAFLAVVHSDYMQGRSQSRLRCWALGQVNYIVGAYQDSRSYVVGFNKNGPTIVQHRASSCPRSNKTANGEICSWSSGFWPGKKNPQLDLIKGGLVWGPGSDDSYDDNRQADDTRLTIDGTVGLTGLLAGLVETRTNFKACQLYHGVFQQYIQGEGSL